MFASCKCNFLTILRYLYFLNEVEWECLWRIQLCRKECKIEKPLLNEECPRSLPHSEWTNKWKQPLFTCYKVTLYDSPSQQRLWFANIFNGYLFWRSPIFNLTHFFWKKIRKSRGHQILETFWTLYADHDVVGKYQSSAMIGTAQVEWMHYNALWLEW